MTGEIDRFYKVVRFIIKISDGVQFKAMHIFSKM